MGRLRNRIGWIVGVLSLALTGLGHSQSFNVHFLNTEADRVRIPFEYKGHLPLISVRINGFPPLKFIFDTGAEHTVLLYDHLAPVLGLDYHREVELTGADLSKKMKAYLSANVELKLGEEVVATHQNILILQDNQLHLEQVLGERVYGILGASLFRQYLLEIDYADREIVLHRPGRLTASRLQGFSAHPMKVVNNKPYLNSQLLISEGDTLQDLLFLMDTGAGIGLMVATHTDPRLKVPEGALLTTVGIGLSGNVRGFIGRTRLFQFEDFSLFQVVTNYQELPDSVWAQREFSKNGIVGNVVLERFTLILDYNRELIWVKPDRAFSRAFKYDRSGLTVIAAGPNLDKYFVNGVLSGSPADRAGLQRGDRLLRINGMPVNFLNLGNIINKFQKKVGKRTKVVVRRGEEKLKFEFQLEKII